MQQGIISISLLILSNIFMTLAWYGHLQFKKITWLEGIGLFGVIMISWGLAFFEYIFQVPANRIGHESNGGPYNLFELKVIQEVVSLTVFTIIAVYVFKTDKFQWNYIVGFIFLILAVFFIFKKW
jgi:uncharacterized protein (DUF486 family)